MSWIEYHCTDQCNDRVAAVIGIGGVEVSKLAKTVCPKVV